VLRRREYEREKKKKQRLNQEFSKAEAANRKRQGANRTQQKKEADNKKAREAMRSKRGATGPEEKEAKREDARKKRSEHTSTPEKAKATRERKNEWARNNRKKQRQKIEQLCSNPPPDTHSREFLKWEFHNRMAVFKDSPSFKSLMRDEEVVLVIDGGLGSNSRGFYFLEYSSYPNSRTNAEGGYRCAASYGSCDKKKEFSVGRFLTAFDWEEEGKFVGNNASIKWVVWDPADAAEDYKKLFCRGVRCHRPTIDWAESKEGGANNALFLLNKNEWTAFLESKSSSLSLLKCLPVDSKSARDSYEQRIQKWSEQHSREDTFYTIGRDGVMRKQRPYRYDPGAAERMRKHRDGTQKRLQCKHGGKLHCKHEGCPNFYLTEKEEKRRMRCNHNHGRKCSVEGCPNQRRKRFDAGYMRGPRPSTIICNKMQSMQQQLQEEELHKWDVTSVAKEMLQMIEGLDKSVTLIRLTALWRGTRNKVHIKGIDLRNLPHYGKGIVLSKGEVGRIMQSLIRKKIIQESEVNFSGGFAANYVRLGPNAKALQEGNLNVYVAFPSDSTEPDYKRIYETYCGKLDDNKMVVPDWRHYLALKWG